MLRQTENWILFSNWFVLNLESINELYVLWLIKRYMLTINPSKSKNSYILIIEKTLLV